MRTAYCNRCRGELPDGAKFCQRCRATADGSMTPADFGPRPSHMSSFPPELKELYDSPFLIGKGGFANVGDSQGYVFGEKGVKLKTTDHSYVQALVKAGTISEDEAFTPPQKNILERVLGHDPEVEVDFYEDDVDLEKGDVLHLSSDSLLDYLHDNEIRELAMWGTPGEAVMALIDVAIEKGTRDNVTVITGRLV